MYEPQTTNFIREEMRQNVRGLVCTPRVGAYWFILVYSGISMYLISPFIKHTRGCIGGGPLSLSLSTLFLLCFSLIE